VLGAGGAPGLVSPNQREAESLVGKEFHDEEAFLMALDAVAELGARNVLIGHGAGAFALFREDRRAQRFEVSIPRHEPLAPAGAGDSMLARYPAATVHQRAPRGPPQSARAARAAPTGAAATLAVGGGRFDPREVSRLAADVTVREMEPVAAE